MQRWRRCGLALLASSMANALPGGVAAQNEGGPARAVGGPAPVANAVGALAIPASEAPRVDGYDLEDFWQRAPVLDRFIEYHPAQDADPRFRTEVRFAYDADNLYILARMYDPAPDSIMTN
ncbi:MAG TPA: hypothetical protein VLA43_00420, partial [Longimicrobiales bacterium]|nr:hypothetical protein [Longimicrobiales bacterium]